MNKLFSALVLMTTVCTVAAAQSPVAIHSHNDYDRIAPFWEAYSQHCTSIEADVFLRDGQVLVAHNRKDVRSDRSLAGMYVDPIVKIFRDNEGRMWKGSDDRLQLVIDLKTAETITAVVELLGRYPDVFASEAGVRVVLTGNVPNAADFGKWPDYIWFDGDFVNGELKYTADQLERIAMISTNFRKFAPGWSGKGSMARQEMEAVSDAVAAAHAAGKPIRFWNAPEGTFAYITYVLLGCDFVNTDHPAVCHLFFEDWPNL